MSNFSRFMKENKAKKEPTTYAATKSLTDEKGAPLLWTIKPISTRENDAIRDDCTRDVPVTGRPGVYRPKIDMSKYIARLVVASVVEPNLYDAKLQDSYGVSSAEDLVREMVDDPAEYADFSAFIQSFNGFDVDEGDKVKEAKN